MMLFILLLLTSDFNKVDMKGTFLLYPPKGIENDQKYYFLNQMEKKIEVFSTETWIKTIGGSGEGPGKFNNVISFAIFNDQLMTLQQYSGRVQFLDLDGSFVRSLRLKDNQDDLAKLTDIAFFEDFMIVTYSSHDILAKFFDLDGELIHIIKKPSRYPSHIGNAYHTLIDGKNKRAYLFNLVDSETHLINLETFTTEKSWFLDTSANREAMADMVATTAEEGPGNTIILLHFKPLLFHNETLHVMPAKRAPNGKNLVYRLNLDLTEKEADAFSGFLDLSTLAERPFYIGKFNNELIIGDVEGSLFTKPLAAFPIFNSQKPKTP